jgi:RNA polymerase sigma-70 factor (ECF subfamily)
MEDGLELLLDKLSSGDAAAAEEVFRAYEPYLRMVVRRMLPQNLRSKFDSVDVVQSVWADVLTGFREAGWRFQDVAHLRAFLVRATRNRFIDRVREHRAAVERHEALPPAELDGDLTSPEPRPSDVAAAQELWQLMLTLCPPQHRRLLEMKRNGASLSEIAAETGLHESSIRRILYDLAQRLAREQHKETETGQQQDSETARNDD